MSRWKLSGGELSSGGGGGGPDTDEELLYKLYAK